MSREQQPASSGSAPSEEPRVTAFRDGRALNTREAAQYLGLSASTLAKMRVTGAASPAYVQAVRNGAVRYRVRDLDAWREQRIRHSTSEM